MSATNYGKFFWSDWRGDPTLRACSFAARGLWMDLLCIMAEHDGFLLINDKPPNLAIIARTTGGTPEEIAPLLEELESNGVFSRDRRRVIYSRRMVKSEKMKRNGRLGGNPNLFGTNKNPDRDEPHIPDTRIQTPESKKDISLEVWPADALELFWELYPPGRKTGKKAVAQRLDRIRKSSEVSWGKLIAGVQRYAASKPDPRFTKGPLVWLNQGCWDDEITASSRAANNTGPSFTDLARDGILAGAWDDDTKH